MGGCVRSIVLVMFFGAVAHAQSGPLGAVSASARLEMPHPGTSSPPNGRGSRERQVKTMRAVCAHEPVLWRAVQGRNATLLTSQTPQSVWFYVANTRATDGVRLQADAEPRQIRVHDGEGEGAMTQAVLPGTIALLNTSYLGIEGDMWGYYCRVGALEEPQ